MEMFTKLAKRFVKSASTAISDSVKTEAKNVASSVIPTLIGIGLVFAGLSVFRSSLIRAPKTISSVAPTLSTTSIVTNNWILDEASKSEVLKTALKQVR